MNYKDLPCYGCMRCHQCATLLSHELHSMLVCWHPDMAQEYADLQHELDCLEEYLEEWDRVDAELAAELDDPYAQKGVSRDDF